MALTSWLPQFFSSRPWLTQDLYELAGQIRYQTPVSQFTTAEQRILSRVFSNCDRNTFFIRGLPEPIVTVLMAMYSRLKDERGIRGIFVGKLLEQVPAIGRLFLPQADDDLAMLLQQLADQLGRLSKQLRDKQALSEADWRQLTDQLDEALSMGWSIERQHQAVSAEKIKKFLNMFLEKFGHNSIARMGVVHLCCEKISTIAAKAIENSRPGAGFIELSTRFVDVSKGSVYPIWQFAGTDSAAVEALLETMLDSYRRQWEGCAGYWQSRLAGYLSTDAKEQEMQINGKLGDTVGNLLPTAFLTSVGVSAQGEAFAQVVKHLLLDGTPECVALAAEIIMEADQAGDDGLLRHFLPGDCELLWFKTLPASVSDDNRPDDNYFSGTDIKLLSAPGQAAAEAAIKALGGWDFNSLQDHLRSYRPVNMDSHVKLPRPFEAVTVVVGGRMTWRTWRDLSRQGFSTHFRSLISPDAQYLLPPDVSEDYRQLAETVAQRSRAVADQCRRQPGWNPYLTQYLANMGAMIDYTMGANLRQMEFLVWQRTSWGAHFEVRRHAAAMHRLLSRQYDWWSGLARADTQEYIFARGNTKVPYAQQP